MYLRQALATMREEKLFSGIYIVGTAMALAFTMVMAVEAITNRTNADFFHIYEYEFVAGRAFTAKEVEAHEEVCVISDRLAERLFGKETDPLGQLVALDKSWGLRVVGVIRGASALTPDSHADVLVPYTLWNTRMGSSPYTGPFDIVATVKDNDSCAL